MHCCCRALKREEAAVLSTLMAIAHFFPEGGPFFFKTVHALLLLQGPKT
jgi:hypothetical protein